MEKKFEKGKLYRMEENGLPFILEKKCEKRDLENGGGYIEAFFLVKFWGEDYLTRCDIHYDKDGYEYLNLNLESEYGSGDDIHNWFGNVHRYACDMYVRECSEDEWENL